MLHYVIFSAIKIDIQLDEEKEEKDKKPRKYNCKE